MVEPPEGDRLAIVYRSPVHRGTWVAELDEDATGDVLAGPMRLTLAAVERRFPESASIGQLVWWRYSPDVWHLYALDPPMSEDLMDVAVHRG